MAEQEDNGATRFQVDSIDTNMPLDPQAAALLKATAKAKLPPLETLTPEAARKQNAKGIVVVAGRGPDMFSVFETEATGLIGAIPLRAYTPRDPRGQIMPLLIFIHGGGHVIGSRETHDVACRHLAMHGDCIVVSIDYHLAPEHPFPAPLEDCRIAAQWIVEHAEELGGRSDWIAVAGDSAGGNLATEMCLAARNSDMPSFVCQLLFYPDTDMTCSMLSHEELADGYQLTRPLLEWFIGHYTNGKKQNRRDPRCSPLLADDVSGLPPTLIISAGYDPLRDEVIAYHEKLLADGVQSQHWHYAGMIHGFISMTGFLDAAHECLERSGNALQKMFHNQH